jgi:soluble lytic murein transglycosylase
MLAYYLSFVLSYCHDPKLALAIMKVESNFNSNAVNQDSYGLMQVRLSTARWIGCVTNYTQKELLGAENNIKCGCKYLKTLSDRYKSTSDVVSAYNAGEARICRTGILKPSGNSCTVGKYINQDYVDKVFKEFKKVQQILSSHSNN